MSLDGIKMTSKTPPYMVELIGWLYNNERSQSWLARKLGVSSSAIFYWMNGITKPTKENKDKIKELTGIIF